MSLVGRILSAIVGRILIGLAMLFGVAFIIWGLLRLIVGG
jgi:hypothetical protein